MSGALANEKWDDLMAHGVALRDFSMAFRMDDMACFAARAHEFAAAKDRDEAAQCLRMLRGILEALDLVL